MMQAPTPAMPNSVQALGPDATDAAQTLDLSCLPLGQVHGLEDTWRELETRVGAQASAFLSWPWISAWLGLLPPATDVRLLQARMHGHVVGLALLVRSHRMLGPLRYCEAWHLHACGDPAIDRLCVEHNDFLVMPAHADMIRAAMLGHWRKLAGAAAELHLPGLPGAGWARLLPEGMKAEDEAKPSFGVDLNAVRAARLDHVSLLSSHARRFIRRSIKEYQAQLGPLVVDEADSPEQARHFLAELVRLHELTWQRRGLPGAFAGRGVQDFHHRLIDRAWAEGGVQLLRVRAGEKALGYLYSFVRGGRLYVYQSGFDYALLEKHGRPGLVTHVLAVQHYAARGHLYYDLLAGESQYKTTVATVSETMTWSIWRKPAWRFGLEQSLKRLRRRLRRKPADTPEHAPAPTDTAD